MMCKKIVSMIILFFVTISACASILNNSLRYQYTRFLIVNNTTYPVAFLIVDTEGTWKIPVAINVPMLLNPNEQYQNTLKSAQNNNDIDSFVSTEVAQVGNEHENYLIFAENGSGVKQFVSAHVFDGLGKIFVGSITNHCVRDTSEGYADCELIVQE